METTYWAACIALLTVLVAAATDHASGRIPNWLTLPVLGVALGLHLATHGVVALLMACAGVAVCALPNGLLFARGALGGGDVKLFAALGALLGPGPVLEVELLSLLLVLGYVALRALLGGQLRKLMEMSGRASLYLLAPARFGRPQPPAGLSTHVRMGPAIAFATGCSVAVALGAVG